MAEGEENMKESQITPEEAIAKKVVSGIENSVGVSRRGFLKGVAGFLGLATLGAARKQEEPPDEPQPDEPTEEPMDTSGSNEGDIQAAAETTETGEVTETPVRYTMRWNLGAIERPQNSEQQQLYDEQKPFVTEKMADWLATMHGVHPELDRLATLFEEANTSGRSSGVPTRFYVMPTYISDIAIRKPRTWYEPVTFRPFVNVAGVLSFNFSFYYDAISNDRYHHTPLDLALAIYNWQTAREMLEEGATPEDIYRRWNSAEVVGIYADDMDKVINIYREVRDNGVLSTAELDEFSGFWGDPTSILKGKSQGQPNPRQHWLAIVRNIFRFKYSNSELSGI